MPFLLNEPKKNIGAPTSRRRHWTITRNSSSRQKGKEKEDDHLEGIGGGNGGFGVEVPAWQLAREAHAVDFGSFALLEAELEAEMRRRKLGIGVNGVNGSTGGVLDVEEKGGDKQQDFMFEFIRDSLDASQALRNAGGGEDGMTATPTPGPKPTPAPRTVRTGTNLLANAYWTSQRAAEAEGYIRDLVYGGVDGLAYVRSLAEFVGDSCLYRVRVFFSEENKTLFFIIFDQDSDAQERV